MQLLFFYKNTYFSWNLRRLCFLQEEESKKRGRSICERPLHKANLGYSFTSLLIEILLPETTFSI